MPKKMFTRLLFVCLCLGLFTTIACGNETIHLTDQTTMAPGVSHDQGDDTPYLYPLMHMSKTQLDEEETEFKSLETYSLLQQRELMMDRGTGAISKTLLPYITYIPSERNQGSCGDCWVWAATGALEIDHAVTTGIHERFSTQYFNSKYNNGEGANWACCGGSLGRFTSWYNTDKILIPWSNTNAGFGDKSRTCGSLATAVPQNTISVTPHYELKSISYSAVPTTGVGQTTAIANIMNIIDNNKALYYTYHFGSRGWNAFYYNWSHYAEPVIFNPDSYGGESDAGGHGVLVVGYDTADPANPYWIVLNSWGTTSGRPNGLFRLRMDMNYDNTYTNGGSTYSQHKFYVLDSTFQESGIRNPAPRITGITPSSGLNSSTVSITNLAGTGFFGTPVVKLNRTGYPDITATAVKVVSSVNITCTFPLTDKPAGVYTVIVTNSDGQSGMLGRGFNVTADPVVQIPGSINAPTDPDGDGLYEDLNGNGRMDFSDVVLYFDQMEWIIENEPVRALDMNGNSRIDFADVVVLFNEI